MPDYPAGRGYPTDPAEREARRRAVRRRAVEQAEAAALRATRSITCAESPDHSTCSGALNCLCPCHDSGPATSPVVPLDSRRVS